MSVDVSQFIKTLRDGEEGVAVLQKHWMFSAPSVVLGILLVITSAFFTFFALRYGVWGVLVLVGVFFAGTLIAVRGAVLRQKNAYVITTQRIIDVKQKGLFMRLVSDVPFEKVANVTAITKGVLPTLFRYGTVHVLVAGANARMELDYVARPVELKDMLVEWQERVMNRKEKEGGVKDVGTITSTLQRLLATHGVNKVQATLNALKQEYDVEEDLDDDDESDDVEDDEENEDKE